MPPVMTYSLAALCVIITAAHFTSDNQLGTLWYALGHLGSLPLEEVWNGHPAPLLTSVFLHLSIPHILFNMMWFVKLGSVLEETLNPLHYALFLVSSAVIASGAEVAFSSVESAGMSGVVYAMCGLMWAGRARIPAWRAVVTRQVLNTFIVWGLICVIATWTHALAVANAAHFGGLLFGLVVGNLFIMKRSRALWGLVIAFLIGVTICSFTWMPWSGRWTFWKGNQEANRENYSSAIKWYEQSMRLGEDKRTLWYNIAACWHNLAIAADTQNNAATAKAAREQERRAQAEMLRVQKVEAAKPPESADPPPSPQEIMSSGGGNGR